MYSADADANADDDAEAEKLKQVCIDLCHADADADAEANADADADAEKVQEDPFGMFYAFPGLGKEHFWGHVGSLGAYLGAFETGFAKEAARINQRTYIFRHFGDFGFAK